jgi:hypothetical protein
MAGLTKAGSTDKAGGHSVQSQQAGALTEQELRLRQQFEQLGLSQTDAIQAAMAAMKQDLNGGQTQLAPLSQGNQALLDQAYAGANANLQRQANILGQDMAGTRGLNRSDTPVADSVTREFAPQFANLASAQAQQGLGLMQNLTNLDLQRRQFNLGGLLQSSQAAPAAGLNLMNSLQTDRLNSGTQFGRMDQYSSPSWINRLQQATEIVKNMQSIYGGFAGAGGAGGGAGGGK